MTRLLAFDTSTEVMSIALVHETLSQGEIGLVELGPLVAKAGTASMAAVPVRTAAAAATTARRTPQ